MSSIVCSQILNLRKNLRNWVREQWGLGRCLTFTGATSLKLVSVRRHVGLYLTITNKQRMSITVNYRISCCTLSMFWEDIATSNLAAHSAQYGMFCPKSKSYKKTEVEISWHCSGLEKKFNVLFQVIDWKSRTCRHGQDGTKFKSPTFPKLPRINSRLTNFLFEGQSFKVVFLNFHILL